MSKPMLIRVFHWALEAMRAAVGPSEIQPTMDSSTYSKRTFSNRVMSRCSKMEQAMTQKQNRVM